jgi:hypothetical protein
VLYGAGLFAVFVVVGAVFIIVMMKGTEGLHQFRLLKKSNRRRQQRPSLTVGGPEPGLMQVPTVPRLRQLPSAEEGFYQE